MPTNFEDVYANPWQTHQNQIVYDNPWIRVSEAHVTRPDGLPGIYGSVHFKGLAIGVLPVDDDGCTYIVGQYRYVLNQYSWEIPEGGCPPGETPLVTAERELLEETGLRAAHYELLGHAHLSNSVTDEKAFYYLATGLTQDVAQPEGTEVLQVQRLPFADALAMVQRHEITDAISVMAIQQYALREALKSR